MRKFIFAVLLSLGLAGVALATTPNIQKFSNGFRLINGAQLNTMVNVINGLAYGETALAGNPTAISTGLTTIAQCSLTLKTSSAPTTTVVSYTTSGGTLNLYGWMPQTVSVTTLVASNGTETIGWDCTGSK